jgi:hypothetical protein
MTKEIPSAHSEHNLRVSAGLDCPYPDSPKQMAKSVFRRGTILFVFFTMLSTLCISTEKEIAPEDAQSLVKKWLTSQGYDTGSSRFILEPDPEHSGFPEFYFFSAAYEQEQSVPTLGHFAVNRKSTDLWDWELCKRLRAPAVRSVQRSLRKKLGLSKQDYRRVSKDAPCSGPT